MNPNEISFGYAEPSRPESAARWWRKPWKQHIRPMDQSPKFPFLNSNESLLRLAPKILGSSPDLRFQEILQVYHCSNLTNQIKFRERIHQIIFIDIRTVFISSWIRMTQKEIWFTWTWSSDRLDSTSRSTMVDACSLTHAAEGIDPNSKYVKVTIIEIFFF